MAICIKSKQERRSPRVEDKKKKTNIDWMKSCLEHCDSLGISKTIMMLFIHLQEKKHEPDHKEA